LSDIYILKHSKINELIRALEPAEIPVLREILESDGSENGRRIAILFRISTPLARESNIDPDKKEAFKHCFPGKKYDDSLFRYLKTDLVDRIESFIARRGFEKDNLIFRQVLSRELATRKAAKAYNTYRSRFEKDKNDLLVRDIAFYQHCYESEFIHLAKTNSAMRRDEKANIGDVVEYLDRFYLARKLQLCCEIFNVRNVLAVEYRVFLLDEILSHLKNKSYEDTPVILVYFRILMTLRESENEEHFFQLRELLIQHEANFSLSELREMYQYVLNYTIKKINLGNIDWQKTLFDIFKTTLQNRVLMSEGHLSHLDFKNIVTISLRLKEFDWAQNFIEDYKRELIPAERENAYTYNLANLHYNTGAYSQSLKLLQQVEFSDLYYQLDSKSILLKTYFELEETESFFYHVSAFRIFLKRNKLVSEYQRTIYLNLIRYSSQLIRAEGAKKKIHSIRKKIEENRNVADLNWLLSKFEK
jgi:hypothetical protein